MYLRSRERRGRTAGASRESVAGAKDSQSTMVGAQHAGCAVAIQCAIRVEATLQKNQTRVTKG
jgi:hypothetical protein